MAWVKSLTVSAHILRTVITKELRETARETCRKGRLPQAFWESLLHFPDIWTDVKGSDGEARAYFLFAACLKWPL